MRKNTFDYSDNDTLAKCRLIGDYINIIIDSAPLNKDLQVQVNADLTFLLMDYLVNLLFAHRMDRRSDLCLLRLNSCPSRPPKKYTNLPFGRGLTHGDKPEQVSWFFNQKSLVFTKKTILSDVSTS